MCILELFFYLKYVNMFIFVCFQLWVQERLPLATSQETGSSLQAVQQLMKKNQVTLHISGSF